MIEFKDRKILITGGAGLIGSYLVDQLVDEQAEVTVVDDFSKGKLKNLEKNINNIIIKEGDLENTKFTIEALSNSEIVFHLASRAYGIGYSKNNHLRTLIHNEKITTNLIEALSKTNVKNLLAVSSSCVYSDFGPDLISEKERLIEHINKVEANAYYKSKPIQQEFPVIIFSHGLGGNRTQNTANIESLASNGYVVFAIEHTYDANITIFNDSTYIEFDSYLSEDVSIEEFYKIRIPQIKTRADDISFMIDQIVQFKEQGFYIGKICDINNIGIFGHSFGGGTTIVSSFLDSSICSNKTLICFSYITTLSERTSLS